MGYYLEENGDGMQYGAPRRNAGPSNGWKGWLSGVVGVHTTESITDLEGPDPNAENIAAFMARRYTTQGDYGSYHTVSDWDTIVRLIRADREAWADTTNNNHALSISGALQAARWRDLTPARRAQIVKNMALAAYVTCLEAVELGYLAALPPARRITAAEAISGSKPGFYGHGETNPGTRYDPGKDFDWDLFLETYGALRAGKYKVTPAGAIEEDDMALTDEDLDKIAEKTALRILTWENSGRTDRNVYALTIDAGLHSVRATGMLAETIDMLQDVLDKLDRLPREVLAYKGTGETIDVYQKLNDTVAVLLAQLPPEATATFQKSGALAATMAKAQAELAGEVK